MLSSKVIEEKEKFHDGGKDEISVSDKSTDENQLIRTVTNHTHDNDKNELIESNSSSTSSASLFQYQFDESSEQKKRSRFSDDDKIDHERIAKKFKSDLTLNLNSSCLDNNEKDRALTTSMDEISQLTSCESASSEDFETPRQVHTLEKPQDSKSQVEMRNMSVKTKLGDVVEPENNCSVQVCSDINHIVTSSTNASDKSENCDRNLMLFSNIIVAASAVDESEENDQKQDLTTTFLYDSNSDGMVSKKSIFEDPSVSSNTDGTVKSSSITEYEAGNLKQNFDLSQTFSSEFSHSKNNLVALEPSNTILSEEKEFERSYNVADETSTHRISQNDRVHFLLRAVAEASKELENSYTKKLDKSLVKKYAESCLSDYNYLLIQQIELCHADSKNINSKVGLRCIHCAHIDQHFTAASFFPSTISCLASGVGTISARHFFGEKCPAIPRDILNELRITKRTSSAQTRMNGKLGLDAYCRKMAKQSHLYDSKDGGIYFSVNENNTLSKLNKSSCATVDNLAYNSDGFEAPSTNQEKPYSLLSDRIKNPFIPSALKYFWECKYCNSNPYPWRASGSVMFGATAPSPSRAEKHMSICKGKSSLIIPRSATMSYSNSSETTVLIKWNKNAGLKKSERIHSRNIELNEMNSKSKTASVTYGSIDRTLIYSEDRPYTTEFHYFCMMQLNMTRLLKAGGSRGSCPVGFPGLRCVHCNVREFFYTSADHLRNSFSHIPSHLVECSECPDHMKATIESLKALRNKQKSLLKLGSHKIFIDRVWDRMHGEDQKDSEGIEENSDVSDDSDDEQSEDDSTLETSSIDCNTIDTSYMAGLVFPNDRHLTSNFVYFALRQVEPYNLTEKDVAQGRGSFEVGFPGLVCKHCKGSDNSRKFFNRSAYHLRNAFAKIPDHLMVCSQCPSEIKSCLASFKLTRTAQESQLKRGSNITFMDRVWGRLIMLDKSKKPAPLLTDASTYVSELVFPDDAHLVTEFTFFTMQQMMPCNLSISGNGARSTFQVGFPGLECRHCFGYPNARRFFYRTSEILGGNYAHIPNHLMSCSKCPLEVKALLESKKAVHAQQKSKLSRGSQRTFFTRLWNRLHSRNQQTKEQFFN